MNQIATPVADALVRPLCGCPYEEFVHRGVTLSIHADPGLPITAYAYDFDVVGEMTASDMDAARAEACCWVDGLIAMGGNAVWS